MYKSLGRPTPLAPRARDALIGLSALALLLSACATPVPVSVCPAIVPYSIEDQNKAADELCLLVGLAPGCKPADYEKRPRPMLDKFMQDYSELRARLRECQ